LGFNSPNTLVRKPSKNQYDANISPNHIKNDVINGSFLITYDTIKKLNTIRIRHRYLSFALFAHCFGGFCDGVYILSQRQK